MLVAMKAREYGSSVVSQQVCAKNVHRGSEEGLLSGVPPMSLSEVIISLLRKEVLPCIAIATYLHRTEACNVV